MPFLTGVQEGLVGRPPDQCHRVFRSLWVARVASFSHVNTQILEREGKRERGREPWWGPLVLSLTVAFHLSAREPG